MKNMDNKLSKTAGKSLSFPLVCAIHFEIFCNSGECLDWQNSQFTNIVGKDDESAAIEVK